MQLKPMDDARYVKFERNSIAEYAQSNIDSGKWDESEATRKSEQDYASLLPDGLNTENHYILDICFDEQPVGALWVHLDCESAVPVAYIYDIELEPGQRGKGLGKQAMRQLEQWCLEREVSRIALNVFAFNTPAIALYEALGYRTTNFKMQKDLS